MLPLEEHLQLVIELDREQIYKMFRALLVALLITLVVGSPVRTVRDAESSEAPASSATPPEKPQELEEPKPTVEPAPAQQKPEEEYLKPEESYPIELSPPHPPQMPPRPTHDERRRLIFYDQRQTGKYNIRADLDNFMILVIPSSPSSSSSTASLLDFLSRGAVRMSQPKHATKKKQKIHKLSVKKEEPIEDHAVEIVPNDSPIHKIPPQVVDPFIEGRTPYKVDISSTARTDPDARIDLLPAKTPVLRIIRPDEERSGNMYRSWTFPNSAKSPITFRNAKSLPTSATGQLNIATNSVAGLLPGSTSRSPLPDLDDDDVADTRNSFDSLNVGNVDAFGVPDKQYNEDWEWKLLGAQEQCGPDRQRDSYGICQFVPT